MATNSSSRPISQTIQATPAALVAKDRVHTGFFKTPFRKVNLLDASHMGGKLGRPLRWLRLKEWVGFAFDHPRLYGAMIIQNAKYAASGTVYVFDRETRKKYEWLIVNLPGTVRLPENLWKGVSHCALGAKEMHFAHHLTAGHHDVRVRFPASGGMPAFAADLRLHQDIQTVDPLVVSLPIAPDHHTYTHKSPLRLEGTVHIGGEAFHYDPQRDLGALDEQKTFYPYQSRWHWACFVGRSLAGREIAINLVNQMTPEDQPGEDAMWIDGHLMLLKRAKFLADPERGCFHLEDEAGRVRLRFVAEGAKEEKRNWRVATLDYAQHFGRYFGELVDAHGNPHRIDGIYGVVEEMRARF